MKNTIQNPNASAATEKIAHTPLLVTEKVDRWLDELRKILVDRSEFKLADHVVSARVAINMLEKNRGELLEVLKHWKDWSEGNRAWPIVETNEAISRAEGRAQ